MIQQLGLMNENEAITTAMESCGILRVYLKQDYEEAQWRSALACLSFVWRGISRLQDAEALHPRGA